MGLDKIKKSLERCLKAFNILEIEMLESNSEVETMANISKFDIAYYYLLKSQELINNIDMK